MPNKIYALVVLDILKEQGKQSVEIFSDKQTALIEINKMKQNIELLKIDNYKIYLSELNYDKEKNEILDNSWINDTSILKVEC